MFDVVRLSCYVEEYRKWETGDLCVRIRDKNTGKKICFVTTDVRSKSQLLAFLSQARIYHDIMPGIFDRYGIDSVAVRGIILSESDSEIEVNPYCHNGGYLFETERAGLDDRSCTFYFDESSHNCGNIKLSEDAVLRVWKNDREADKYVGCFIGWSTSDISNIEAAYLAFEDVIRKKFKWSDEKEIKSDFVDIFRYRNGLASFGKFHIFFYQKFFEFLQDTNALWTANIESKIDVFCRNALGLYDFYKNVPYEGIPEAIVRYTFIKFFDTYCDEKLLKETALFCNKKRRPAQFKRVLLQRLDSVIAYDVGCIRKQNELQAYRTLRKIIEYFDFRTKGACIKFDYDISGFGLLDFIHDNGFGVDDVLIFSDDEPNTYEMLCKNFGRVEQKESGGCFGVRAADLLAGFIFRMLRALYEQLHVVELFSEGDTASEQPVYVSVDWFDLQYKKPVFELYKLVSEVFSKDGSKFKSVYTGLYCDEVNAMMALFQYFGRYDTFEDYLNTPKEVHYEQCNAFIVAENQDWLDSWM